MLNEKEKVILEILKKDNFNELKKGRKAYRSLEELLNEKSKDKIDAFYIGTENDSNLIDESGYLYFFDSKFLEIEQLSKEEVLELINEEEFMKKYKEENGENDELYIRYIEACI